MRRTKPFIEFTPTDWAVLFNQVNKDDPAGYVPLSNTEYWDEQKENLLEYERRGLV